MGPQIVFLLRRIDRLEIKVLYKRADGGGVEKERSLPTSSSCPLSISRTNISGKLLCTVVMVILSDVSFKSPVIDVAVRLAASHVYSGSLCFPPESAVV